MKWVLRVVAVSVWAAEVAGLLAGLGVVPLHSSGLILPLVVVPGFGTVGLALTVHRPANSVGWLMLGMGGVPAVSSLMGMAGPEFLNAAVLVALVLVLVVFPDGRLPSPGWLVPIGLLLGGWTSVLLLPSLEWRTADGFAVPIGVALGLSGVLWCAAAPFARFRRAGGVERDQLRWLGLTAALAGGSTIVAMSGILPVPTVVPALASLVAMITGALGMPASILVAITRYRLYDIDRVVSRTVTYAVVAVVVSIIYIGPVVALPRLLGESNNLVIACSTLAAAAVFSPARRRIQAGVDRRFNRARYDAAREVESFAARLAGEIDLATVTDDLEGVIHRTLAPSSSALWLRAKP